MSKNASYDVFISYAHDDREWASKFRAALDSAGIHTWFDASRLEPGERWQEKIEEALRDCQTLVLLVSQHSLDRPWTFFEIGAALAGKKRIIPVLTPDLEISQLPPLLSQFQALREDSPDKAAAKTAAAIGLLTEN